jgi:hypothetical protein
VRDGRLVAAVEEERFSRKKHDYGFPAQAIDFCLRAGGIRPSALDPVVFFERFVVEQLLLSCLNSRDPAVPGGGRWLADVWMEPDPDPPPARPASCSASTTSRTPPARSLLAVPRAAVLTDGVAVGHASSGSGGPGPPAGEVGSRTRWGFSTAPSPRSWASRSTRASTR